jgi:hypothetical protein
VFRIIGKQKKATTKKKGTDKKQERKERMAPPNEQAKREKTESAKENVFEGMNLNCSILIGRLYCFLPEYPIDRNDVNSYRSVLKR